MPIFPEHLHVAGEDAQLHDGDRRHRTEILVDGYIAAIILSAIVFAAVVIALVVS